MKALAHAPIVLLFGLALGGCSSAGDPSGGTNASGKVPRDARPDGLFKDFLDGKFDGAGHPLDSEVWQAEDGCNAKTGRVEAEGRGFSPGESASGTACSASSKPIGLGHFTLNVRALAYSTCSGSSCKKPALTLSVKNADGSLVETKSIPFSAFSTKLGYQNLPLAFTHQSDGPVNVEVRWEGKVGLRIDYVELFRSSRNLLLTPASGIFDPSSSYSVEVQDPPAGFELGAACDGTDLGPTLASLLASGEATREDTEFRSVFTIPAGKLLASCTLPARVRFSMAVGSWVQATSRVSEYTEEPPCTFAPDTTRVLLTGFEPFPADSSHDNSSEQAVKAFDPSAVPGISLMTLTLPVEFDTAPGIVASAIARCQPDVVVGFGQGRDQVDVETTAYNLEDSSEIAGGAPDNRGVIPGGVPIVADGPAERHTGLPADALLAALSAHSIQAGSSDDPGRYVCNDVFYRIMTESDGSNRVSGFVHLPYIYTVGDTERAMLKTVVTDVVTTAVAKQRGN